MINPIIGNESQLYGLSTDTKPTTGIKPNSTFYCYDTKAKYIFDGTTWWAM